MIRAAGRNKGVRAVTTIGAPFDPSHVTQNFRAQREDIRREGSAMVSLAGRSFEITRQFLEDIEAAELRTALRELDAALLVLHAPRDEIVGIENASKFFRAARHPKSFVTLDTADHLVTREQDAEYAAEVVGTWSARYLDLAPEPAASEAPEGVVRMSEVAPAGFRQDVVIDGRHQLVADEPARFGGTDLGPTPYQLVSAGLGACTTMTIRLYARRKGIALDHVAVDVMHDKCHLAEARSETDADPAKVDVFRRRIRLSGDLTETERAALLAIADKCPVHRSLHRSARIVTKAA